MRLCVCVCVIEEPNRRPEKTPGNRREEKNVKKKNPDDERTRVGGRGVERSTGTKARPKIYEIGFYDILCALETTPELSCEQQ